MFELVVQYIAIDHRVIRLYGNGSAVMANFMKTYHSSLSIFILLVSQKIITKY